jgi:hypothetical protein
VAIQTQRYRPLRVRENEALNAAADDYSRFLGLPVRP